MMAADASYYAADATIFSLIFSIADYKMLITTPYTPFRLPPALPLLRCQLFAAFAPCQAASPPPPHFRRWLMPYAISVCRLRYYAIIRRY